MELKDAGPGYSQTRLMAYSEATGFSDARDFVVSEEPLSIDLTDGSGDVTNAGIIMRTPIMDRYLAIGFAFTEGYIESYNDVRGFHGIDSSGISSSNRILIEVRKLARKNHSPRFINSSCGICGRSSVADLLMRHGKISGAKPQVSARVLLDIPESMARMQDIFMKTGGLHAAAAVDPSGKIMVLCEDVGRHNAVDKVIGFSLAEGLNTSESILAVSGRAGFEILEKAFAGGFPVVASVSAPSDLAVRIAEALGITLVCFIRGRRFSVYTHPERIVP